MENELQKLRQQLREEQRRREVAEARALEEQQQREGAEKLLERYLEACHELNRAIQVVTDCTLTTQGVTTNPTGRIYPRRIIPWDDFATEQEDIWDKLSTGQLLTSQSAFPSHHQLEYVRSVLKLINSEDGLRNFERDVVENSVHKLVYEASKDPLLRTNLGLEGIVTLESHTNLGRTSDLTSVAMEDISISGRRAAATVSASGSTLPKPRRTAKGKGDPPHKLSVDEIVTGLECEIQPDRDVISKYSEGFLFASRSLVAAVITQLFSYMVGKGIQYGYVCTWEAFVFLHIPDDPTTVYFSICVPNQDVQDDDENRLHRTAVAQVFAFILRALRAEPPPLTRIDATAGLDTWAVEYEDVLKNIPETVRKGKKRPASPYQPQRWRGFKRSPIRTRSRCQPPDKSAGSQGNSDDGGGEAPPSPTPNRPAQSKDKGNTRTAVSSAGKRGQPGLENQQKDQSTRQRIQDRPFCTQRCLLGLANGGQTDKSCPNFEDHGHRHIESSKFLSLLRTQLAQDRGREADCRPLYLPGSVGALFKVRLSSHGYTLVARGVETFDLGRLRHEHDMYSRARAIQGQHVPVCLGMIDLILPHYYDGGVYEHFMFLGWAGRVVYNCTDQFNKSNIVGAVTTAFTELHRLGVLHDAKPRNILYNADSGQVMIMDWERAEFCGRQPLGLISPNGRVRKRKPKATKKQGKETFETELQSAVESVSKLSD
ncbi:hypothetical protein GMORB2_2411 [Geosmithia morbida]|uniref:Protein kinase domain-containing protein n=1 Tax=Geosmithia morbida TaxID=1094350 RepID=A0A9P4YRV1_9HYPO|nr:uncharacterized protein GMORB2_2411 [Geosmithia morbida]KAF4120925.1 hypothetical protein GMORB2_2411 [Geosmithia morbida]